MIWNCYIFIFFSISQNAQKKLRYGNPRVVLNSSVLQGYSDITLIDLPPQTDFEQLPGVYAPNIPEVPISGSWRLKRDISNDPNGCNTLPTQATYTKVLGKISGGTEEDTYLWYNGFAVLENNTPDAPILDGGKAKKELGIDFCTNVAKNFLNSKFCLPPPSPDGNSNY